jgi:lipid-A-disaccharide synthase-like uncharacterized protein
MSLPKISEILIWYICLLGVKMTLAYFIDEYIYPISHKLHFYFVQ